VNAKGQGPAWSNSLFEDNAEFGYGMLLAQKAIRANISSKVQVLADKGNAAAKEWLDTFENGAANAKASAALLDSLKDDSSEEAKFVLKNKDFVSKKSQWIFGGDGWAFDIDFGGLDHVLASGQDVNVLVVNTEVYSNTGGQSSKATPLGAVAQFAAGGKETKQKDLASIAMSYGYVYVAQISMGADMNQAVKAIAEAEAYPGPSLIIAYAPCINHHIKVKGGMSKVMDEEKAAVQTGYWNLFRYNPNGEKKFSLDSKAASAPYQDFLEREARYTSLELKNPEKAAKLFAQAAKNAEQHYNYLQKLNDLYNN
jgi:pyruvate-ferredoxin/flavodoxin oxidoreductase